MREHHRLLFTPLRVSLSVSAKEMGGTVIPLKKYCAFRKACSRVALTELLSACTMEPPLPAACHFPEKGLTCPSYRSLVQMLAQPSTLSQMPSLPSYHVAACQTPLASLSSSLDPNSESIASSLSLFSISLFQEVAATYSLSVCFFFFQTWRNCPWFSFCVHCWIVPHLKEPKTRTSTI